MSFYFPMLEVAVAIALAALAAALLPTLIRRLPRRSPRPRAFRMKGDDERADQAAPPDGPRL